MSVTYLQQKHNVAQVGPLYFRHGVVLQFILVRPGCVETETLACRHSPRSPCPLIGGGLADMHSAHALHNRVTAFLHHRCYTTGSQRFSTTGVILVAIISSVQFRLVQDGTHALGKAHMCSTLSPRNVPNVAFEMVTMFVRLMMALSHPFKEDRLASALQMSVFVVLFAVFIQHQYYSYKSDPQLDTDVPQLTLDIYRHDHQRLHVKTLF